jgi:membrane fusion protein (multidrug efflux system)
MNTKDLILQMAVAATALTTACKGPAPAQNAGAAVPVNAYQVKQEAAAYLELYPGTLVAQHEVQLRSEVNGFITGIFFEEGAKVRKGQKLYEIERDKYAAAYGQAAASLGIAKANLEKNQRDAQRYTRLNQANAVAKQRYDYAITDLENARQSVASAEAQLLNARADLRHSVISAPFDGTIGLSLVKRGTFIVAGQTELNTVSSNDPIAVDFTVSEKDMGRFIEWHAQPAPPKDSLFTILLPDKTVYPFPGRIGLVDRAVDPQTGTIRVRIIFPNPQRQLKSGMSCNLRVRNNAGQQQLLAPFKSVTEQMGEYFVYVLEGDTARQRRVELGTRLGEKVIVRNGLRPGERIVVEGIQKLREGTAVKVNNEGRAAAVPSTAPNARETAQIRTTNN